MLVIAGVLFFLLISLLCFLLACYVPKRKNPGPGEYDFPKGKIYEPFHERMTFWTDEFRRLPHEDVEITSADGLTLRGRYYECDPLAPMELMIHGYRGNAERDMCGGVFRAFSLGRNALVIDQRASGRSDGHLITFGVKERQDCLKWVEYIRERFGPEQKIILTGISMGAATVLMASGMELPDNVIGVLADCGYTSAEDIMKKVLRQIHLPKCLYQLVRLGGRLFGGFDLSEASAIEAVKNCKVPVVFFHGETDNYVPWEMSRRNFEACQSEKRLVLVPGAGHGLSFPINEQQYISDLRAFGNEFWYEH